MRILMFFDKGWCQVSKRFCSILYRCSKCKIDQPSSSFHQHPTTKSGLNISRCKNCHYNDRCTPIGYFRGLIAKAKQSQKIRYTKKQIDVPPFTLTHQYLQELYCKQNGIGFYSHVPLNLRPLSDWQVSLERKDPNGDYVESNVVLEAAEFNGRCQWSMDKVMQIPSLISAPANITFTDLQNARKIVSTKRKPRRVIQRPDNQYYCHICKHWLQVDQFYSYILTRCKSCHRHDIDKYRNTFRGFMMKLLNSCRKNSKKRKSTDQDTRNEFAITLDDLFDKLEDQEFRCKYSGIPMQFVPNSDWMCSVERIDNMKGYTNDNCVLICWEFNSCDRSIHAVNKIFGSSQWSEQKFKYFYKIRFSDHLMEWSPIDGGNGSALS
eukprot:207879_1